jgi:hypothetical protein
LITATDAALRRGIVNAVMAAFAAYRRSAAGSGDPSRARTTGGMVLWVAAMLAAYLVAYYV